MLEGIFIIWKQELKFIGMSKELEVIYTDDVNLIDHANLIVVRNSEGEEFAYWFERWENNLTLIFYVQIFDSPDDSGVYEDDYESLMEYSGMDLINSGIGDDFNKYQFTSILCRYYSPRNFDCLPIKYDSYEGLSDWFSINHIPEML